MKTLIVPCDDKTSRFPGMKPTWLLTHPDGRLMLVKALTGIAPAFERIIVTIIKPHAEPFEAKLVVEQAFADGPRVTVCQLEAATASVPETVFLTLRRMKVTGAFAVKDADSFVRADIPAEPLNAVAASVPPCQAAASGLHGRAFLNLDQAGVLHSLEEHPRPVAAGLVLFASTDLFDAAYAALDAWKGAASLNDIVAYLISRRGQTFRTLKADAWESWGTPEEWQAVRQRGQTYFVDVDGVLLRNSGQYGKFNWGNNREALLENVRTLRALQERGAQIVVVTARTEAYRPHLEELLASAGLRPHAVIMGLHHAARVVINDFAPSNPYPSCLAVSMPRDGRLADYLPPVPDR